VQLVSRSRIRSSLSGRFLIPDAEGAAGGVVRLLLLDELLPFRAPGGSPRTAEMPVLSYQTGGASGALGVSRIVGRREVVVKPLGPPLERMRRYSGAALLDDGSLALVLDLANLSATAAAR
jgi:chemotaxis protein histidine kinase CheA